MKFSTLIVVLRTVTNTEKKGKCISFRRLVHVQFLVSLSSTYTVEAAPLPRACGEYAYFRTISMQISLVAKPWLGSRQSADRRPHSYRKSTFYCSYESVYICQSCAHCSGPRKVKVTGKCHECVREPFSICLEYRLVMVTVTVFAS